MWHRLILVPLLIAALPAVAAAQLAEKKALTLAAAQEVAAAAEATARENGWNVVIAIVDDAGILVYLQRLDGTQPGSVDIAQQKARSAAMFRRPTKAFADAVAQGAIAILSLSGAVAVEGGVPLTADGSVIGAIGVSGVTSQQDGIIAQAGADRLTALLQR